jgi:hypothetical protein
MIKKFLQILFLVLFYVNAMGQDANLKKSCRVYLSKDTFTINTYSDRILNIIPDSMPLNKNAIIKVVFPKFFGEYAWDDMFWFLIPPNLRAGYLQVKSKGGKTAKVTAVTQCYFEFLTTPSSKFDYKFGHENNQWIITIKLQDTIPIGDTLQVIYGANGTATYTYNSMIAHSDRFTVLLDNNNNGNFIPLLDAPKISFKNSTPKNVSVVLPSTAKKQQTSVVKVMISDIGRNISYDFSGTVKLTCTDVSAIYPRTVTFTPSDSGAKDVPIVFNQDGIFTISANVVNSPTPITGNSISNPVNVSADSLNIYWGELHTHGKISRDGFGDDGYLFARNGVGLDFYGATDHSDFNAVDTFGINTEEWSLLKSKALRFHQPGRFVTFLSYENSLDNPSGHYNFIYNFDDSLVDNVPMLAKDLFFYIPNFWTKLNQLGMQGKALTIPHHTGKLFGLTGPDNGASQFGGAYANTDYKRSIEIYSGHGLGEYYNPNHNLAYDKFGARSTKFPCFAQDAWALKEKLGVMASTDSHNGTPSQTNIGYTAVITDSLTRNNIFNALYNRHSYATTGEHIVLKFAMNSAIMGDELTVQKDSFPTIRVQINGTDNIDFIELLKWDFKKGTYTSNPVHPIFQVINKEIPSTPTKNYSFVFIDTSLRDTSMYYVRMKQKNLVSNREVWAWSSPIWVNKPTSVSVSTLRTDSLYNFNLQYSYPNINVNWCMQDELNTDYFVIEKHNTSDSNFLAVDTVQTLHVAFADSCYTYIDKFPDDTVLYYRIKAISYTNGVQYSPIESVHIPFVVDSVYNLKVQQLRNRIGINWNANEFYADKYIVEKRKRNTAFTQVVIVPADIPAINASYSNSDLYPLSDTSYYRVWMNLKNGQHRISKFDTLIFNADSLLNFGVVLQGNNHVLTDWQIMHELNILKYELQRSQDKQQYFAIKDLQPRGGIFDTLKYNFVDTTALPGWNYYRMVYYFSDGSQKISFLDSVRIFASGILSPNKINMSIKLTQNLIDIDKSFANFELTTEQFTDGSLLLVGVDGKIYYQDKATFTKGTNYSKIPIGGLSSGTYFLMYITENAVVKDKFLIVFHGGCNH